VVNSENHFIALFKALGREDVLSDARFANWDLRTANVAALREIIESAMAGDSAEVWEKRLKEGGVAAARVKNIGQALSNPQMKYRNLLLTVPGPKGYDKPVTIMNAPFLCNEDGPGTDKPAPNVGEHNDELLAEAGYSAEQIEVFHRTGAIWEVPALR